MLRRVEQLALSMFFAQIMRCGRSVRRNRVGMTRFMGSAQRGIKEPKSARTMLNARARMANACFRRRNEGMMSDVSTQTKLRQLERNQIFDRRLAIAALVTSVAIGALSVWNSRTQIALSRQAEARQEWSELLLRFDDEQMWKAKKTLRAFVEQVKRQPGALAERNGMDGFVIKTSMKCIALYVYATTVPIAGAVEDCPPKTMKPEDKDKYYSDVDLSRRVVKNFHEKVMLLDKEDLITEPIRQRFVRESTVEFLTNVWLPVEKGQNHVVDKDADSKDKNAESVRDWYVERLKKIREQAVRVPDLVPETSYY